MIRTSNSVQPPRSDSRSNPLHHPIGPILYQPTIQTPMKVVQGPPVMPSIYSALGGGTGSQQNLGLNNTVWMNAVIPGQSNRSVPSPYPPKDLPRPPAFLHDPNQPPGRFDHVIYQPRQY